MGEHCHGSVAVSKAALGAQTKERMASGRVARFEWDLERELQQGVY